MVPWVGAVAGLLPRLPGLASPAGHAHEMLFGYVLAVAGGFLLGRQRLRRILGLLGLWLAARIAFLGWPGSALAVTATAAFSAAFAVAVIPRFARSARKWRNRSIVLILGGLAALAPFATAAAGHAAMGSTLYLATTVLLASLLFFMGGRIIAPAVAGYLVRGGGRLDARVQPRIEGGGLLAFAAALAASAFPAGGRVAGIALLAAALLTLVRLVRWSLWRCRRRPDLLVLGLGYGWLAAGLGLLGLSLLAGWPATTRALHALTVGAVGTLTVAVMARTRLLYRYRDANIAPAAHLAALLMSAAAAARMGWSGGDPPLALLASGAFWSVGCMMLLWVLLTTLPAWTIIRRSHSAITFTAHATRAKGNTVSDFDTQFEKMKSGQGFIAALDQSGGSTPKALRLYGIEEGAWSSEEEMFDLVHEMRTRIITSPAFNGDRILAAILFENTMDRQIEGKPTAEYLWRTKQVVPILKVDKGLAEEADGVQLMKPIPNLDDLLARAKANGIFGTKMRSVIKQANEAGIRRIVEQQFELARQIIAAGLVPIVEPEVDIKCPEKAKAETMLKAEILRELDSLGPDQRVMLKLTLPEQDNFYMDLIEHPNVVRVVALSGGYSRSEANERLARQNRMVASFSRALTEGLKKQQSDEEFDALLDESIGSIYEASIT